MSILGMLGRGADNVASGGGMLGHIGKVYRGERKLYPAISDAANLRKSLAGPAGMPRRQIGGLFRGPAGPPLPRSGAMQNLRMADHAAPGAMSNLRMADHAAPGIPRTPRPRQKAGAGARGRARRQAQKPLVDLSSVPGSRAGEQAAAARTARQRPAARAAAKSSPVDMGAARATAARRAGTRTRGRPRAGSAMPTAESIVRPNTANWRTPGGRVKTPRKFDFDPPTPKTAGPRRRYAGGIPEVDYSGPTAPFRKNKYKTLGIDRPPPPPPTQKMFGKGSTMYTTNNKYANQVLNSKPGRFARRHPYAIGGGVIGATAMSNAMGPGRAGSPKGSAVQAKGIYGF